MISRICSKIMVETINEKDEPFVLFFYLAVLVLTCGTWELCCGMQDILLRHTGFSLVVCGLSCPVACGALVPQPGIEPASPALEGGFFFFFFNVFTAV